MDSICIWFGWINYESGYDYGTEEALSRIQTTGEAYGQYQFDYRYGLVPFMQYCSSIIPSSKSMFAPYIAMGAGNKQLVNNAGLHDVFKTLAKDEHDDFLAAQNAEALRNYLFPSVNYIKNNYGYNIEDKGEVVVGSLFSMSIRSGSQTAAQKYANCSKMNQIEIINSTYDTYGGQDAGRWNTTPGSQRIKALDALKSGLDIFCINRNTGYPAGVIPTKRKKKMPIWMKIKYL